jgi:hypothetical protein
MSGANKKVEEERRKKKPAQTSWFRTSVDEEKSEGNWSEQKANADKKKVRPRLQLVVKSLRVGWSGWAREVI